MFLKSIFVVALMVMSIHSHVHNMLVVRTNTYQGNSTVLKANRNDNLRITVVYNRDFKRFRKFKEFVKYGIEPAVKYFQRNLKPKVPLRRPLIIDRLCYGKRDPQRYFLNDTIKACFLGCSTNINGFNIPERYFSKCTYYDENLKLHTSGQDGSGVENTDLILFVNKLECFHGALASAGFIMLDTETDRPVAGSLNICNSMFYGRTPTAQRRNNYKNTILHELVHILGFGYNMYAYYRDAKGRARTPRNKYGDPDNGFKTRGNQKIYRPSNSTFILLNRTIELKNGFITKEVAMLITPALAREAKRHFKCPSLTGIFLEDYDNSENSHSHFERSFLHDELMVALINPKICLSRFTLAVLEDSGWYYVNYRNADTLYYGKNLGCEFFTSSCYRYITDKKARSESTYPYCDTINGKICTDESDQMKECTLFSEENYELVPQQYRYFDNRTLASYDMFMDYCPIFEDLPPSSAFNLMCPGQLIEMKEPEIQRSLSQFKEDVKCIKDFTINKGQGSIIASNISLSVPSIFQDCYKYICSNENVLTLKIMYENHTCEFIGDERIAQIQIRINDRLRYTHTCSPCGEFCQNHTNECWVERYHYNHVQQFRNHIMLNIILFLLAYVL